MGTVSDIVERVAQVVMDANGQTRADYSDDDWEYGMVQLRAVAAFTESEIQQAVAAEVAQILAWLKAQYAGRLQSTILLADAIERGEYKETSGK